MSLFSALAVSTSTLAVPATSAGGSLVIVHGNAVLNEEVYRAVLDLPREARASRATARLVRTRLLDFLHRAGYELATVRVEIEEHTIAVDIDEGRVDKVIIRGQGAFQTLRFKLDLDLPHNVFNRRVLERELRKLTEERRIKDWRWELVPVSAPEHFGPQLESLPPVAVIESLQLIPERSAYELHVILGREEWELGLAPELSFDSLEGLGLGMRYRDKSLMLSDDRFELRGALAGLLRKTLEDDTRLVLSRAMVETRWHTPPLVGEDFRSFLWLRSDLLNRQRADLGLDAFFHLLLEASLNLEYRFISELSLSLGAGLEHRILFAVHPVGPVSETVDDTPDRQTRLFGVAALDLVLNQEEIRRDRKHALHLEARFFDRSSPERRATAKAFYAYQKMFSIGWHELWLRSSGAALAGDTLFPDEEPIGGKYLRGPFVDEFYARKVASGSAEFRISVVRDLFKVSFFHDLAAFGAIDRTTGNESPAAANAFGLGLHALLIDAFQLDAYFGFGFATGGKFDHGIVINLRQAY